MKKLDKLLKGILENEMSAEMRTWLIELSLLIEEERALRQPPVVGRSEQLICPECENTYPHMHIDGTYSCEDCGHEWSD